MDAKSDAETEVPATPKPTKVKKRPRKSQPNMAAVAAEQSQAAMDGDMILKLRLTKKYYADALRFIQQIEDAIPTLSKLLISTNKTEVLESMRFFRTAYEYNVQSADVSF
jgi:condensin complex subunit 1